MEIIGEWRQLHSEYLYGLHYSTIVITMMKSRKMRGVVQVARKKRIRSGFGGNILKERSRLDDLDVDGRIIVKWILSKYDRRI